ncbi:hypothetical protein [Streptomyces sp. NPDC055243]|uniref:hypothetical protein n=1 Tax=Streptomyces sp. NPDC055243 TaxID=3365720 RepID=UPI0037D25002
MATHTVLLEDGELEFENDVEWIYSDLPEPDPNWRGSDSNGHEHHYAEGPDRYPTLKQVAGEPYWCDSCEDEHVDTWLECPICGEQVTPGTRPSSPKPISMGQRYYWNGEPISHERASEIISVAERARDEAARITERPSIGSRVRFGEDVVTIVPTAEAEPTSRVTVMRDGSGATETVDLDRLRRTS